MDSKTTEKVFFERTEEERKTVLNAMLARERNPAHGRHVSAIQDLDEYIEKAEKRSTDSIESDTDDSSDTISEIEPSGELDDLKALRQNKRGDFPGSTPAPSLADTAPSKPQSSSASTAEVPDPERRLIALRELGGTAKYKNCEWTFTCIEKLAQSEKAAGRKRTDVKTIRSDLKEAAQAERDAKTAGYFEGLGQQ